MKKSWHNFVRKFENDEESGRNRLPSSVSSGVWRISLNSEGLAPVISGKYEK